MKRFVRPGAFLLLAALLFCLSGCYSGNIDQYFSLPMASEEYRQLQSLIDEELASGSEYSAPIHGSYRQSVQLSDVDGDGADEALAFFRDAAKNPKINIYDSENGYGKATSVSVVMSDKTEYEASIIGYDTDTDIAVLKIDASGLTPAEFGNSDDLEVGELVLAIGNPLGFELFGSVTSGIVSALNRDITINDKEMNLIQTDAAINSGNSGGPLVNSYGQVVGINSAKMTSTYSSASVEGLGFAIPITQAKDIIDDLINYGYVKGRPQLGITCIDIDEATASLYNMPVGTYVRSVTPNGAAALAGIQEGDIIIGVNGEAVSTTKELNEKKNEHNAGDSITLTISRNGKDMEVKVTLQEITQGDTLFGDQEAVEN